MSVVPYLVGGAVGVFLLYQFSFYLSAIRMRGRKIDGSEPTLLNHQGRVLLYFYSDRCAPCRDMTPLVDQMREQNENVVKLNVQKDAELAKALGVRATPTFVVVENGKVSKALLGIQSSSKLQELLGQDPKQYFSSFQM